MRAILSPLRRFWLFLLVPAMLLLGSLAVFAAPPLQDGPPITYLRYDTEIDIQPDGSFIVREIQQVQFDGEFSHAFAEIPLDYAADITDVRVRQDDSPLQLAHNYQPGNYKTSFSGNALNVAWGYQKTTPGDVLTFTLEYAVQGGLWVYADETILEWRVVPADRSGIEVKESRVTVNLPAEVPADALRYTAYGPEFSAAASARQVVFTATQSIPDGVRFQVQVGFPSDLTQAKAEAWQIEEDSAALEYRLTSLDTTLSIAPDGHIHVTELHHLAVDAGAMRFAWRLLPMAWLDNLQKVTLFEGDQSFAQNPDSCQPYCFKTGHKGQNDSPFEYDRHQRKVLISPENAGFTQIEWAFPALVKGEETTFRLSYDVEGALSVTPQGQTLRWGTAADDWDLSPEKMTMRVILPPGVDWQDVSVRGVTVRLKPDGSIVFPHDAPLRKGEKWTLNLTLPPDATTAQKPVWQQELEAAQLAAQQDAARRARWQLAAGVVGVLLLLGGLLFAWLVWYLWGRDKPALPLTDYLTEPPSDLPPGIVAYLVDEKPTAKGVLASLFHLAELGLLRLDMTQGLVLQRNWEERLSKGQSVQTPEGKIMVIPYHLVILFNALRPHIPMDKPVSLFRINKEFQKVLPRVYYEMAEETTRFFNGLPAAVRHRWLSVGQWLVLAGIVGGAIAWWALVPDLGNVALAPPIALLPVGLAFMLVSRWMPQRNTLGVEEAARWRAFRSYLENMKEYGNLDEAQKILDDYFAYAVALNVEEIVLAKAEEMGGVMPVWTFPTRLEIVPLSDKDLATVEPPFEKSATSVLRRRKGSRSSKAPLQPLQLTRLSLPKGASGESLCNTASRLSLSGLSRQLGETLEQASEGISYTLNVAAGDQGDTPFTMVLNAAKGTVELTWDIGASTLDVVGDILEAASSGSGGGGYSSDSDSSSDSSFFSSSSDSTRWSSSSSRSSSSSGFSSGRDSSSRRSGGGGSRGFG